MQAVLNEQNGTCEVCGEYGDQDSLLWTERDDEVDDVEAGGLVCRVCWMWSAQREEGGVTMNVAVALGQVEGASVVAIPWTSEDEECLERIAHDRVEDEKGVEYWAIDPHALGEPIVWRIRLERRSAVEAE